MDVKQLTVLMLDHDSDAAERMMTINDSMRIVFVTADHVVQALDDLRPAIEFTVASIREYAPDVIMKGPSRPAWRNLQRGRWAR